MLISLMLEEDMLYIIYGWIIAVLNHFISIGKTLLPIMVLNRT